VRAAAPGTRWRSSSTRTRSAPGTWTPSPRRTPLVNREIETHRDEDEAAFAARFQLVHEWRKFLFDDPGLPVELLPSGWPGQAAGEAFASEATRLKPASDRFVARCLSL
jgi:phenylacetic acid degradation operon negative regulatory protein